jgi:RNA polymerase sigma factor (sigma-70 family)
MEYQSELPRLRGAIERMLRLAHAYDARRDDRSDGEALLDDLCEEAVEWIEAHTEDRPSGVGPSLWLRKTALGRLDEHLERQALANGGLYRSWSGTADLLLAAAAHHDPVERKRWLQVHARAAADGSRSPVSIAISADEERERMARLERAIVRLPELRRRVVLHYYFDQLTSDDIAYLLDSTVEEIEQELLSGRRGVGIELCAVN